MKTGLVAQAPRVKAQVVQGALGCRNTRMDLDSEMFDRVGQEHPLRSCPTLSEKPAQFLRLSVRRCGGGVSLLAHNSFWISGQTADVPAIAMTQTESIGVLRVIAARPASPPIPHVLFIDDLAAILRVSRSTIERRRRSGDFPIAELPAIDDRPRWSSDSVRNYLNSTHHDRVLRRKQRVN